MRSLGSGDIVGCGDDIKDAPKVAEVVVFTIKGVEPEDAVVTTDATYGGIIYVAEGLAPSEWPPALARLKTNGR